MISEGALIAGISAVGGIVATGLAQVGSAWLKRRGNGRLDDMRNRNRFYADMQKRLETVESDLRSANQANLDLQRNMLSLSADLTDAIARLEESARGIFDLRQIIDEHLSGHPQMSQMMQLLERMETRTRWPRQA